MFKYVFRVDASVTMGSGHVMRCLTLAHALREQNQKILFICRDLPGNMNLYIRELGYEVSVLPYNPAQVRDHQDASTEWSGESWETDQLQTLEILRKIFQGEKAHWLIVDHYGLDERWEHLMRQAAEHIMVIDDLANRRHDCDLLLDQNLYMNMQERYRELVPPCCESLVGPQFAMLRPEFYQARLLAKVRTGPVKRMLVFFGGSDATNETMKVLKGLTALRAAAIEIDVIVGAINPQRQEVEAYCRQFSYLHYHCQINNMAEMISRADAAVGAGGATTWERCYLGLPALVVTVAQNQIAAAQCADRYNLCRYIGHFDHVSEDNMLQEICNFISNDTMREKISRHCWQEMQGQGQETIVKRLLGTA